ncbi:hypothetical protein [Rhodohalobacter sp. 8-1]|uniref:hypothetical protein n=1 Tax=Rhodohalobacter sp. 8-1 TaxID=3131972 RepID=UPI0030EDB0E7
MGILVADSGGTKTDWVHLEENDINYFSGGGLHPAYMTIDQIADEIESSVPVTPKRIFFYGAGCHGPGPVEKIEKSIHHVFPGVRVMISDDLTGVARAHLQQSTGFIAALGTGSICGRYESGEIVQRSAAMGYAIGDEGSAADLGRKILKAYFRDTLDPETAKLTRKRLENDSYSEWMGRIYTSKRPNKELAAVAGKVFIEPLTNQLQDIITLGFLEFIDSQFSTIFTDRGGEVVCTGTVAVAHEELLKKAFTTRGFEKITIKENVIEGLARYHQQEKQ